MQIIIRIEDKTVTAFLNNSEAARNFASLLPLRLTLKDYAATEKVADLPARLKTEGAPAGHDPEPGDIAYYAPWGNLAIFYKDFAYSRGLVHLGKIESGLDVLRQSGSLEATIELQNK